MIVEIATIIPGVKPEWLAPTRHLVRHVLFYSEYDFRMRTRPSDASAKAALARLEEALASVSATYALTDDRSRHELERAADLDQDPHQDDLGDGIPSGQQRVSGDMRAVERLARWAGDAGRRLKAAPGRRSHDAEQDAIARLSRIWFYMSTEHVSRVGLLRLAQSALGPLLTAYGSAEGKPPNLERAVRTVLDDPKWKDWVGRGEFDRDITEVRDKWGVVYGPKKSS